MSSESKTKSEISNVIEWASISYAFGFVIVTVHTARLGLPVLEVLKGVYIWIGLPLAALAFFLNRIAKYFLSQLKYYLDEARTNLKASIAKHEFDEKELSVTNTGSLFSFMFSPINEMFDRMVKKLLYRVKGEYEIAKLLFPKLKRFVALFAGISAIYRIVEMLIYVAGIFGLIFLYVWKVYPAIPQTLGGGQPRTVRLLVSTEKVAAILLDIDFHPAAVKKDSIDNIRATDSIVVTSPIELLYTTEKHYYVQNQSGKKIAIATDIVKGVVWNP